MHACAGYIPPSTWIRTIKNGLFSTWPGQTTKMVAKHLPKSIPTTMGRLHMNRKNIRTTKPTPDTQIKADELSSAEYNEWVLPALTTDATKTNHIGVARVLSANHMMGVASTDLTGRFPITSVQGIAYLFVMYDYDSNTILAAPIRNRTKGSLIAGLNQCLATLKKAGIKPVLLKLDNEVSKDMVAHIEAENMTYQLASPGDHRTLPAERAIQTMKNHCVSIFHGDHPSFTPNQWDRLLPQAFATLNMMRRSRLKP